MGIGIAIGGGGQTALCPRRWRRRMRACRPWSRRRCPRSPSPGRSTAPTLRELELSGVSLSNEDIEPLKYMVNLTALEIRGNLTFDQLEPLAALTNLETLTIVPDGEGALYVSDLSPLSKSDKA